MRVSRIGERRFEKVSTMEQGKFGVAIAAGLIQQLEEMRDECENLGVIHSEIVGTIITM